MGEKQGGRSWLKGKSERDDVFTPDLQPSCDGIMSTNYNSNYPMIARHGACEFLSKSLAQSTFNPLNLVLAGSNRSKIDCLFTVP